MTGVSQRRCIKKIRPFSEYKQTDKTEDPILLSSIPQGND